MKLRLLDLDGSLPVQPSLLEKLRTSGGLILDLRDLGPDLRLWASGRAMRDFERRLVEVALRPEGDVVVTFLGSGDFHHLVTPLIAAAETALTVLHFDNHPDWVRLAPRYHCGSWVNRALALANVARVITIGPCGEDLVAPQLKGGNLAALASGTIELHPWRHGPSRVWGTIGSGAGHTRRNGHLVWGNVGDVVWSEFLSDLLDRLPTEAVWITIDKDVLRPQDAVTNWDQGEMPLSALLEALGAIGQRKTVVGVDVCGDYAPPRFTNPLKAVEAWFGHPDRRPRGDTAVNNRTNHAILHALSQVGL